MTDKASIVFLVVDDSATMRRIIKASLAKYGFTNHVEAGDGDEALAKVQAGQIHCILTDWNMPNCDGMTFIAKVRALPGYATVPIIMITTEQSKEDVVEALTHGVNAYIVKPFTPELLKTKLDGLLKLT